MWRIDVPSFIHPLSSGWRLSKQSDDDPGDRIELCLYLNRFGRQLNYEECT